MITPEKSIAVLPFVNMSADKANEYFSDGITEEIINALTKVKGLKVIARTSSFAFKGKNIDVRTIGRQLGVTTVLEGSVRKAQQRVRITAQLINTEDGTHYWSRNFDRELNDIFALQDEISLLIADQIRENFGHFDLQDHLIEAPTRDIKAYNLYLKGRYHQLKWNAEDLLKGVEYYQQSIEQDPTFALPYFGAGLSYGINASWGFFPYQEGMARADQLLKKGFQLNQESYQGYFAKATVSFWGQWDFRAGHDFLLQTIALNPSFTDAEEALAELYTAIGRFEEAMRHTEHILSLNPLSPNHYYTKGNIQYLSGEYEQAIESMQSALRVDPAFSLAIEMIAVCYLQLKDYPKLDTFLREHPQAEKPESCRALFHLMYPEENIEVDLEAIRSTQKTDSSSSLILWPLYLQVYLGHHQIALDMLEKAIQRRAGQLINFKNDPFLKPLRDDDRFQQMVQKVFHVSRMPVISQEEIPAASSASSKSVFSEKEIAHYTSLMTKLLETEQLYLDSSLSLKSLADQMNTHPNKLSWLINEQIGKNFNEFINSYRLNTFKQKALDPANSHLTILGLAYESGFNSKTAFNSFFKKAEGTTPRAWLKSQQV